MPCFNVDGDSNVRFFCFIVLNQILNILFNNCYIFIAAVQLLSQKKATEEKQTGTKRDISKIKILNRFTLN